MKGKFGKFLERDISTKSKESDEHNAIDVILAERTITETNLVLDHGADEPHETLTDNTFMCEEGSYVPKNYALNRGGVIIRGKVDKLKCLDLTYETDKRLKRESFLITGTDPVMRKFLETVISDRAGYIYEKRGLDVFTRLCSDAKELYKLIDFAKAHGLDALKFNDESLDTWMNDKSYLIFDGSKIKVIDIIEP